MPPRPSAQVTIPRAALEAIFDECDRYDQDETGGRIIGTFKEVGRSGRLSIVVSAIIEPGPNARRTPTSFFQDGEHQEEIFRSLERQHPEIEHLGNWHTHHVNGYPRLSGGDRATYHRIVDHENHNIDFFYALLVTKRRAKPRGADRYKVKHFILRRNTPGEVQVPASRVKIVDQPILWPRPETEGGRRPEPVPIETGLEPEPAPSAAPDALAEQRALDQQFLQDLRPSLCPYRSKITGGVYWRGEVELIDGAPADIIVAELGDDPSEPYGLAIKNAPAEAADAVERLSQRRFRTAAAAVLALERELDRKIFTRVGALAPKKRGR